MPLQQRELLRGDRFFHVQGIEHLGLFGADGRDTSDGFGSVEPNLVMLDAAQVFECPFRRTRPALAVSSA